MENMTQEEKLRREMQQDAERKAKRAVDRAKREAKKLVDAAQAEAMVQKESRLAVAKQTADERERAILAGIEHEKRRSNLLAREVVIQEVLETARVQSEKLAGDQRKESLASLLGEAIEGLKGDCACVRCSPEDEQVLAAVVGKVSNGLEVVADAAISGGLIASDKAETRSYDNTYTARLARMEDELRAVAYNVLSKVD